MQGKIEGSLVQADQTLQARVKKIAIFIAIILIAIVYWERDVANGITETKNDFTQSQTERMEAMKAAYIAGDYKTEQSIGVDIESAQNQLVEDLKPQYTLMYQIQLGALAILIPVGLWLLLAGAKILRAGQYPVPKAKVLRDTYTVVGAQANIAAGLRFGLGLLALGGGGYAMWQVWAQAQQYGLAVL